MKRYLVLMLFLAFIFGPPNSVKAYTAESHCLAPTAFSQKGLGANRAFMAILAEIKEPFADWPTCKKWMQDNYARLQIASGREKIPYGTICYMLQQNKKVTSNWTWEAGIMDLANRLRDFLDRTVPAKGLNTWEDTQNWLINNSQAAIEENNTLLAKEGEKRTETLSNLTLASLLFEAKKTLQDWTWKAGYMDLSRRLKGFMDRTVPKEGLNTWKDTREKKGTRTWLINHLPEAIAENNDILAKEGEERTETLSYGTLARLLFEAGKTSQDWSWEAGYMDLANRLKGFLDRTVPKEGLTTWKDTREKKGTRTWLIEYRQAAIDVNNTLLAKEGEERTETLSYSTLASLLFEAGKTSQDWTWNAGYMDLAIRLEAFLDSVPEEGLNSWKVTRNWLINNRQAAIDENNARLAKEGEERTKSLSNTTLASVLFEARKTAREWSLKASGMDYVRNNWQIFIKELRRCYKVSGTNLPDNPDALYEFLLGGVDRNRFRHIKSQRDLDNISKLQDAVKAGKPYTEAARSIGLSSAQAKRLSPYVEERAEFIPNLLGQKTLRIYLKEFCQTWFDIHNYDNLELANNLRQALGLQTLPNLVEAPKDALLINL